MKLINPNNTIVLSVGVFVILILSVWVTHSRQPPAAEKKKENAPGELVNRYIALSLQGDFHQLSGLLILPPPAYEEFLTRRYKQLQPTEMATDKPKPRFSVVARRDAECATCLKWVREEFPQTLFDQKLRSKQILKESISNNLAKVEILLGNDEHTSSLPWAFLLYRENEKVEWKIFEIVTYAQADGFPSDN